MTLGQAIRVLRKNRNLNQQELALKVGISNTSISQIELDKKWPSRSTIESICQVLHYTMEDLFKVASTAPAKCTHEWCSTPGYTFCPKCGERLRNADFA